MNKQDKMRRRFVQGVMGAAGITAFGGLPILEKLARAATCSTDACETDMLQDKSCATNLCKGVMPAADDHYFIFAYFRGGWDILLSLDVRDPYTFNNGVISTTRIQPAYEQLSNPSNCGMNYNVVRADGECDILGPFMGDLINHFDKLCVVRGMSMDTLTHEAGMRRFLTGRPPAGLLARGSSSATWLASYLGQQQMIPNLSMRVESYNVDLPNYATGMGVNSVNDLIRVLKTADPAIDSKVAVQMNAVLKQFADCKVAKKSAVWQQAQEARVKAQQMVSSGLDELFNFRGTSMEMAATRDHYNITNNNAGMSSAQARAAAAATAIMNGVARVVTYQANDASLDTHYNQWTTDQGPTQESGFNSIARLVEHLECTEYKDTGTCWLDHVTICGFSEFSRTPLLNTQTGRDHWLMNACFLLGAAVKGAQILGVSSDEGMMPTTTNLETGLPDPGGEIVKPEHVLQALFHSIGVVNDEPDLRVKPLKAILKS
jgi:hypothetical protein